METTTKYLRINPDGSTELVVENRSSREISESIARQFSCNITLSLVQAFSVLVKCQNYEVDIISTADERYLVTWLDSIRLNIHLVLQGDHIVPVFLSVDDSAARADMPKSSLKALFPSNMFVAFACRIQGWKNASSFRSNEDQTCYLIAYSADKRAWRLPLPNIFEDGAMCMGKFDGTGSTAAESFSKAIVQLDASEWNSDLIQGRQEMAQKLFRFNPQTNAAVPFEGDWATLCEKIATPVTVLIGGLL